MGGGENLKPKYDPLTGARLERCYVYFVAAKDKFEGRMKIGISNNVKSRISTLTTIVGVDLVAYSIISCCCRDHAQSLESSLHRSLKTRRLRVEWFSISDKELSEISRLNLSLVKERNIEDIILQIRGILGTED